MDVQIQLSTWSTISRMLLAIARSDQNIIILYYKSTNFTFLAEQFTFGFDLRTIQQQPGIILNYVT